MKKMLFVMLLMLGCSAWGQNGNTFTIPFNGAPTGSCAFVSFGYDTVSGDLYRCSLGVWVQVGTVGGGTAWATITGTPTTLSGYGITDALPLSGGTMTGAIVTATPAAGTPVFTFTPGVSPTGGSLSKITCWSRTADTYISCYDGSTTQQIAWQSQFPAVPGASGLLKYTAGSPGTLTAVPNVDIYTWTFDGGGSQVAASSNGIKHVGAACTAIGWAIEAKGSSPTATIDVWRVATGTAIPTVANTIMGTKPALASGNAIKSTTMTSWCTTGTCTFAADDILIANADATNAANVYMTFSLLCAR